MLRLAWEKMVFSDMRTERAKNVTGSTGRKSGGGKGKAPARCEKGKRGRPVAALNACAEVHAQHAS